MANGKAKAGGQYGENGEFYEGGQFLPNSENTIKGALRKGKKARASRVCREQIAPREWAEAPEGKSSIWAEVSGVFAKYDWGTGELALSTTPQVLARFNKTEAEVRALVDRWNAGERWM
jgi:hypothetical protein